MKEKNLIESEKEYQDWLKKNKPFLKRFIEENLRIKVDCRHRGYISVSLWNKKEKFSEDDNLINIDDDF